MVQVITLECLYSNVISQHSTRQNECMVRCCMCCELFHFGYFIHCNLSVSRSHIEKQIHSLELSKRQMKALVNQVQTLLDMAQVMSAGPFLYACVQEGTPDVQHFSRPNCLNLLARFTLEAYVKMVSYLPPLHTTPFPVAVDKSSLYNSYVN